MTDRDISRDTDTEMKDAVFGLFFNINQLKQICATYGATLAHNMHILPGAKTVRITAEAVRSSASISKASKPTTKEADPAVIESKSSEDELTHALKTEQQRAPNDDDTLRIKHEDFKRTRNDIFIRIARTKQQLYDARQAMYRLRQRLSKSEEVMIQPIKEQIVLNHKGIGRVEDFQMSTNLTASGAFNFSGTDKGLVTMTDTVRLSMERFKFHLSLFITSFNGQQYELKNGKNGFLRLHESDSFKIYSTSI
ncbi:MAG: hypothetical protein EXX96DRAFT_639674 [Benjaminiella poitrasii]|nr:MAG: hypothetical protein EXX96DRAFT_639674 [Benjaminiella poitrasii]